MSNEREGEREGQRERKGGREGERGRGREREKERERGREHTTSVREKNCIRHFSVDVIIALLPARPCINISKI